MTPQEHQQEQELQQAMEDEVEQLIRDAQRRPITDEEAVVLLWHCGLPIRKTDGKWGPA